MGAYEDRLMEAMTEAESRGKEPFDFEKFSKYYMHDTGNCEQFTGEEPLEVQLHYKRKYYVDFEKVNTIEEFANLLDEVETQS